MNLKYECFEAGQSIPVTPHLKSKKLAKYFNRETAAFMIASDKLLSTSTPIAKDTPCYYSMGIVEFEDYGLPAITLASQNPSGHFSEKQFATLGMASVSPLTQFKILYNMPLCFFSIEHGMVGDNAVLYTGFASLVQQALCAPGVGPVLIGAGKVHEGGRVESACALLTRDELEAITDIQRFEEAIDWFRENAT